jgi:hypothetical protein
MHAEIGKRNRTSSIPKPTKKLPKLENRNIFETVLKVFPVKAENAVGT